MDLEFYGFPKVSDVSETLQSNIRTFTLVKSLEIKKTKIPLSDKLESAALKPL